jgi:hypothetical protein
MGRVVSPSRQYRPVRTGPPIKRRGPPALHTYRVTGSRRESDRPRLRLLGRAVYRTKTPSISPRRPVQMLVAVSKFDGGTRGVIVADVPWRPQTTMETQRVVRVASGLSPACGGLHRKGGPGASAVASIYPADSRFALPRLHQIGAFFVQWSEA